LKLFLKNNGINKKIKIGLQVETGLNRLGIGIKDLCSINTNEINLQILISHLASSDELKNKYNQKQNNNFQLYFNLFKSIKYKSLVSSMGILLGKDFHYDLIRPGISIYGGHYNRKKKKIIVPVVTLKAKILQIKTLSKNEYVGYNQTYKTHGKIIFFNLLL
jgi:alanine racemase